MNPEEIIRIIQAVVKELFGIDAEIELTRPEEQFGDFATNVALRIAHQTGQTPRETAQAIADNLSDQFDIQVAGPGFINIRLKDEVLFSAATAAPHSEQNLFMSKTILVEYSDPNPLKPLHAGHLYTTLVGNAISQLVENAGAKTVRLNYGGDVGLHVGKSMWGIVKELGGENPDKLAAIQEAERPSWLGARYVEGNNAYEDNEALKSGLCSKVSTC